MKTFILSVVLGAFVVVGSPVAFCADDAMAPADLKQEMMPDMSPEDMAQMKDYMTPNENHKLLESLAGEWKTNVKFWMDPKSEPQVSEGTSTAKMIMNGRFLEQSFNGTAMGQPFEGRGILGYDNIKKEFTSTWLDNMATGIMTATGKYDPSSKILTSEGSMSCPMTNETHRWYKDITTITDADHYTYESYMKDKDGKEFKGMEITYTRAK